MKQAEGKSGQNNIQQALQAAIRQAEDDTPGADRQISWKITEIRGVAGGFAGLSECVVTIVYTDL